MTEFKVGDRVSIRPDKREVYDERIRYAVGSVVGFNRSSNPVFRWLQDDPEFGARVRTGHVVKYPEPVEQQSDDTPRGVALARGDRQESYGHPKDNFLVIADLWTAYLDGIKYDSTEDGTPLSPENVGAMMVLLKVARTINDKGNDSVDDIDGYAECIRMIREADASV